MSVTGFRNSETTGSAAGYVAPSCSSAYTTSSPVSPPSTDGQLLGRQRHELHVRHQRRGPADGRPRPRPAPSSSCPASVTYDGSAQHPVHRVGHRRRRPQPARPLPCTPTTPTRAPRPPATATRVTPTTLPARTAPRSSSTRPRPAPSSAAPRASPTTACAQTPCTVSVTGAGGLSLAPTAVYANNTDAGTATAGYSYPGDADRTASSDSTTFVIDMADPTVNISGWSGHVRRQPHTAPAALPRASKARISEPGSTWAPRYTNVPGGTADWTYTDATGNYNDASGSVGDRYRQGRRDHRRSRPTAVHL